MATKSYSSGIAAVTFLSMQCQMALAQTCAHFEGAPWNVETGQGPATFEVNQVNSIQWSGVANTGDGYCARDWPMSGFITGNYFWGTLTNPNGEYDPLECVEYVEIQGTVEQPGCNWGVGSYSSPDYPTSEWFPLTVAKTCDVPGSESSEEFAWWSNTLHEFRATLAVLSYNGPTWLGRTINEADGPPGFDECHSKDPEGAVDPFDSVSGAGFSMSPAPINSNNQYRDLVGWSSSGVVDYYRSIDADPCYMHIWQQMVIDCTDEADPENTPYELHDVWIFIDPNEFAIMRDGEIAVQNY